MKKIPNLEKNQKDDDDLTFEGEETLGKEYEESLEESSESNTLEVYPDAVVNIFPESQSAFQLLRKYQKIPPLIKLDPDFQRSSVWSSKQKSELIESILMGIPLPIIYVKEDENGTYIIVDGRQRLTTLFDFMTHKFALNSLTVLKNLNGKYFSDDNGNYTSFISQLQQSKIEDCQLNLNVIKPPTPDRVTFDLFDRVNRGGTRLNNQEMRNAIYQGKATLFLNELASKVAFKEATENSVKPERMKDKYLILRLVAFYLWRKRKLIDVRDLNLPVEYKSDLEDFLSKTMLFLNSPYSADFRSGFPELFEKAMKRCHEIWGKNCFRLPHHSDSNKQRPINMALFESATYFMIEIIDVADDKKRKIEQIYKDLIEGKKNYADKEYIKSLTYIVDSNISVVNRFEIVEKVIEEVLND